MTDAAAIRLEREMIRSTTGRRTEGFVASGYEEGVARRIDPVRSQWELQAEIWTGVFGR